MYDEFAGLSIGCPPRTRLQSYLSSARLNRVCTSKMVQRDRPLSFSLDHYSLGLERMYVACCQSCGFRQEFLRAAGSSKSIINKYQNNQQ